MTTCVSILSVARDSVNKNYLFRHIEDKVYFKFCIRRRMGKSGISMTSSIRSIRFRLSPDNRNWTLFNILEYHDHSTCKLLFSNRPVVFDEHAKFRPIALICLAP